MQEALRLFEADSTRTPYTPTLKDFVVSPVNARQVLGEFIDKAKKQLLIYDPTIADPAMLRALGDRKKAGVEIRVIGHVSKQHPGLEGRKLAKIRLHTRTIIRDHEQAFVGSQSLRAIELDSRREVGVIVREPSVVSGLLKTFEADWLASAPAVGEQAASETIELKKATKDLAKDLVKELSTLNPIVKEALKDAKAGVGESALSSEDLKETVKGAVKEAILERVEEAVKESLAAT